MKIKLFPSSHLSAWSIGLNVFFVLASALLYVFGELLNTIPSEILITAVGSAAILASIAAFVTGIIAVTKNRERCLLVFLSILIGFAVLSFIIVSIVVDTH